MAWPMDQWMANQDGLVYQTDHGKTYELFVVDCGELLLPTGRLVVCDPFCFMEPRGNDHFAVPPGRYPVTVTLADVSGRRDCSQVCGAYATLLLDRAPEVRRIPLTLTADGGVEERDLAEETAYGFAVDAGTACFVDDGALASGMPPSDRWYDDVFENDDPGCWFNRIDDPEHIREGLANVPLPLARDGANIVLVQSGQGDGVYPVVGGFDATDRLVAVHVDFMVA